MCRDIGGSDPERMAAPRVSEYVQTVFKDSPVQVGGRIWILISLTGSPGSVVTFCTCLSQVSVISDLSILEKEYPCLAAVNRCANGVCVCVWGAVLPYPRLILV